MFIALQLITFFLYYGFIFTSRFKAINRELCNTLSLVGGTCSKLAVVHNTSS